MKLADELGGILVSKGVWDIFRGRKALENGLDPKQYLISVAGE